jgi:hypothetical protein
MGVENLATDHLSRLENLNMEPLKNEANNDTFLDELLLQMEGKSSQPPWFADFANYLVAKILPK